MFGTYLFYEFFCSDVRQVPKPSAFTLTIPFPDAPPDVAATEFGGYTLDLTGLFEGENPAPPDITPSASCADPGGVENVLDGTISFTDYINAEGAQIEYSVEQEIYGNSNQGEIDTNDDGVLDQNVDLPEGFDPNAKPASYKPADPPPPPNRDDYSDDDSYNTAVGEWKGKMEGWKEDYKKYAKKKYWTRIYEREAFQCANKGWVEDVFMLGMVNSGFYRKHRQEAKEYQDCITAVAENAAREEAVTQGQQAKKQGESKKMIAKQMQKTDQQKKAMEAQFINRMAQSWRASKPSPKK